MTLLAQAQELTWRQVPRLAIDLAEKMADTAAKLRAAVESLPQEGFLDLWYCSDTDHAILNFGDWAEGETMDAWKAAVEPLVTSLETADEAGDLSDERTVKVASRTVVALLTREKRAADPYLKGFLQNTGYLGGKIPGAPSPLIGTLASGLLGAGAGYGGGWLTEQLLPETKRWNLKARLAMLGGAAGAAPGVAWMGTNVANDLPWYSGELMVPDSLGQQKGAAYGSFDDLEDHPDYSFDSEEFNRAIWEDRRVADRLPPQTQAAATGLVTGAAHLRGSPRLVSPMDVARLAAGMGSGYTSGAIVGKALGVLMGMPQNTQNKLKQTGMWAGLVSNILPLAFSPR